MYEMNPHLGGVMPISAKLINGKLYINSKSDRDDCFTSTSHPVDDGVVYFDDEWLCSYYADLFDVPDEAPRYAGSGTWDSVALDVHHFLNKPA